MCSSGCRFVFVLSWCLFQTAINLISLKLKLHLKYLDDLLNIDNPYYEQMVGQIYPTELSLIKRIAPFFDLNLSITNGIASSKIHDKWDDFNFEIVNFPLLFYYILFHCWNIYIFNIGQHVCIINSI